MGGRGSSSSSGGDGFERKGATSVADGDMGKVDLSGSPLRYGKLDKALDGERRAAVEKFESRYRNAKVENGATFDENGNITEQRRGGKGSVKTSIDKYNAAQTFSHNHPREEGVIGGTFSEADLSNFSTYNVRTVRATAKEGTYSISKGRNFDSKGFREYYRKEYARVVKESNSTLRGLNQRIRSKDISYDKYVKEFKAELNKQLVGLHNALIKGQKSYGYSYTLERGK